MSLLRIQRSLGKTIGPLGQSLGQSIAYLHSPEGKPKVPLGQARRTPIASVYLTKANPHDPCDSADGKA